ncbi:MAG TPA: hypothetical protein VFO42_06825 [Sphingomicrobium sp.]|nr:hypothetical protein [Sphingomicrobium sp.]
MTPFEFVFALISIVTSLAMTKIITGVVAMIRYGDRSTFSLTHAIWIWTAFAIVLGNWGALWGARLDPDWPLIRVFGWLVSMTSLYAFCALVVPETEGSAPLDLKDFHERESRRYITAHNIFTLVAILVLLALSGVTAGAVPTIVFPFVALVLGIAALRSRGRLQLAASALTAVLATLFMVTRINLLST